MTEPIEETIMEERETLMVSPKGENPSLRFAHFLKPTLTSIKEPVLKLPSLESLSTSTKPKWPFKVAFNGWLDPQQKWKQWVDQMQSVHQSVWQKAGISEAIMASTYKFPQRNTGLIYALAQRWCPETNTFIFPWGEATLTLEDVMILGGFSVLGDPVSKPLETEKFLEIESHLIQQRKLVIKSKSRKASQGEWLKQNMDSGSVFEHEAFLALWVSRFVIPSNSNHAQISGYVLPIAVHLGQGTRIALAPAVLASIYKDLRLLKETMTYFNGKGGVLSLRLSAPFQLLQFWAWERLPPLQPKPEFINPGEPRLSRWTKGKLPNPENMSLVIEKLGKKSFLWRPYVKPIGKKLSFHDMYKEKGEWVSLDEGLDEELEILVRWLRASELVGLENCIEQYLPHRVSMQFGMDQDLPDYVPRSNTNVELAWKNYSRPICDEKLYIPSLQFEPGVTFRYFEWWNDQTNSSKCEKGKQEGYKCSDLPPKSKRIQADKLKQVKFVQSGNKDNTLENCLSDKNTILSPSQSHYLSSSATKNEASNIIGASGKGKRDVHGIGAGNFDENMVVINDDGGERSGSFTNEIPKLPIEDRISKLEKVFAALKAARFGQGI